MMKPKRRAPDSKDLAVPQSSLADKAHAVVRAGLGAIPVAGQGAIELFSALILPPLEKRRNEWMEAVGQDLARLAVDRKIDLDELQQNQAFTDLVMSASQAAIRNANEEKRQALRNAIRNAALGNGPDEDQQQMFIRWVDEFGVWHLRILKLFQNPAAWADLRGHVFQRHYMSSLNAVLEEAYPDLKGKSEFYNQVWRDLQQRGLTNSGPLQTMMTSEGTLEGRTSGIGDEFLRFIADERQDPYAGL